MYKPQVHIIYVNLVLVNHQFYHHFKSAICKVLYWVLPQLEKETDKGNRHDMIFLFKVEAEAIYLLEGFRGFDELFGVYD